jgi:hypothetical protein
MELVCAKKLEVNDSLRCKNEQLHLEYYLLSGEDRDFCTYGVQINMVRDSGETETVVIKDVLSSRTSMIDLIKRFYSNSVTPISAHDIIYDYIA